MSLYEDLLQYGIENPFITKRNLPNLEKYSKLGGERSLINQSVGATADRSIFGEAFDFDFSSNVPKPTEPVASDREIAPGITALQAQTIPAHILARCNDP